MRGENIRWGSIVSPLKKAKDFGVGVGVGVGVNKKDAIYHEDILNGGRLNSHTFFQGVYYRVSD